MKHKNNETHDSVVEEAIIDVCRDEVTFKVWTCPSCQEINDDNISTIESSQISECSGCDKKYRLK